MTYSQYQQYSALLEQLKNLNDIANIILEKVPIQLGEKEYNYNKELQKVVRDDLLATIDKHVNTIKNEMENL